MNTALAYSQITQLPQLDNNMLRTPNVVKPLTGLRKYFSVKFKRFIEGYEEFMYKKFPSTYRMLQMFTIGTKDFSSDVLQYMKLSKELTFDKSVTDMSYKELIVYMRTPKDLRKMAPFLLLTAVPFAQYVTLPLAYVFPKQLLSLHYWTIEQRTKFAIQEHTKRLHYYRPVFRQLQNRLHLLQDQTESYNNCRNVFAKLGSGTHPTVDQILEIQPLFSDYPYGLDWLSHKHLIYLCKMHQKNILPGKKNRLKEHIYFIKELDIAWDREDYHDRNLEELRQACFLRGLNPVNLSRDEMLHWFKQWIQISKNVNDQSLSLMLHAPIFLAYNHPSNWRLIH